MKWFTTERSPSWAFMSKFVIPNLDDPSKVYLTRYRIIQTPWFGICIHRMDGPDSRPTLHDHPWGFTSIVLRGGYIERRWDPKTMEVNEEHRIRFLNYMPLRAAHSIRQLLRYPTWTLVLTGRRVKTWGFLDLDKTRPHSYRWTAWDQHRYTTVDYERAMQPPAYKSPLSESEWLEFAHTRTHSSTATLVPTEKPWKEGWKDTSSFPSGGWKDTSSFPYGENKARLSGQRTDSPALGGGDDA